MGTLNDSFPLFSTYWNVKKHNSFNRYIKIIKEILLKVIELRSSETVNDIQASNNILRKKIYGE
jgi:hypothetical protein